MAEESQDVQENRSQGPIPYVTAEMAWEMSKRAAAEAREDAIREVQTQMQNSAGTQGRDQRNDRYNDYEDRGKRRRRREDDDEGEEEAIGFSPKLVKQLQTTVGVFNTLKDFASNPMQKAIEDRIGGLAAGIIEQAFTSPRGPPPKKDMIDTLLNSQIAYGLGQGLGSRAPELIESLSKSFGREKAENMIEGMIGKYGGDQNRIESSDRSKAPSPGPQRSPQSPQKSEEQSNIELLLSLDPNNPEHVSAYSESQGGISIDVARKMLMIHQDDIIKRMKFQGADTSAIESQRGSRIGQDIPSQKNSQQNIIDQGNVSIPPSVQRSQHPSVQDVRVQDMRGVQSPPPVQYPPPVQNTHDTRKDMQYVDPSLEDISKDLQQPDLEDIPQDFSQPSQEYVKYSDIKQQEKDTDQNPSNNRQEEIMKTFADDIGKVMGDMINKIEALNNTVFALQNEVNEVKKQSTQSIPVQTSPVQASHVRAPHIQTVTTQETGDEYSKYENIQDSVTSKDFFPDDFEREPDQDMKTVQDLPSESVQKEKSQLGTVGDFRDLFPEKTQSMQDFQKELEEETRLSLKKLEKKDDKIKIDRKPILSMVNKKKINYSMKQERDNSGPRSQENEDSNDSNTDEKDEVGKVGKVEK